MTLSIIIINYNVYDDLFNCLKSIIEHFDNIDYEIIVADNNSVNRDIERINTDFPDVIFLQLEYNAGFSKANNIAVKLSSGDYLLFLNPDTLIIENFAVPIINYIKNNTNCGSAAPMLLYKNKSYQSSAGPAMGLFYDFLESFNLVNIYRKNQKKNYFKDLNGAFEVGWVSAACLIIKKEIFLKVKGFTESYFLNYEDIDLGYKLNSFNYKNYYLPRYSCIHLDHRSFDNNYELLVTSRYKSRIEFARLHYSYISGKIAGVIHITGLLGRLLYSMFQSNNQEKTSRREGYIKSLKIYLGFK